MKTRTPRADPPRATSRGARNELGYGDAARYELLDSRVARAGEDQVTIEHRLRDRRSGEVVTTPPFTNYQ